MTSKILSVNIFTFTINFHGFFLPALIAFQPKKARIYSSMYFVAFYFSLFCFLFLLFVVFFGILRLTNGALLSTGPVLIES